VSYRAPKEKPSLLLEKGKDYAHLACTSHEGRLGMAPGKKGEMPVKNLKGKGKRHELPLTRREKKEGYSSSPEKKAATAYHKKRERRGRKARSKIKEKPATSV